MGDIVTTSIKTVWDLSKTGLISVLLIGLIFTNIMTLVSDNFYDNLYGVLANVVPSKWVQNSKYDQAKRY